MPDAVLFDFDGTLAPCLDLPALRRDVAALTVEHGVPQDEIETLHIVEIVDHARAWLTAHGGDGDTYHAVAHALIRDTELAAADATEVFAGVRPLLRRLAALGVGRGVVTRNCEAAVRRMFPDIDAHCDALYARDHVAWLKPDVRHLQACLDHIGARPAASVMVGDGAMDMRAGKALGMHCVGVLSGTADHRALVSAGASVVIEHVVGLDRALAAIDR